MAYRAEAEAGDEAAVEEAVGEEGDGRHGVDDGEDVVELEGPVARPVVRLVHVPQGGVPQRLVRPLRPELHPDLHRSRAHGEELISPVFFAATTPARVLRRCR